MQRNALLFSFLLPTVLLGCGNDASGPSGRYTMKMGGDSMSLDFKDGGRVLSTLVESGSSESMECNYRGGGEQITLQCPDADPVTLTLHEGALEATRDGVTMRFTKN